MHQDIRLFQQASHIRHSGKQLVEHTVYIFRWKTTLSVFNNHKQVHVQ